MKRTSIHAHILRGLLLTAVCCLAVGVAFAAFQLPGWLQAIEDEAYMNCDSLDELDIPAGTRRIGARAFANCDNLASVRIPRSVSEIGEDAFALCPKLTLVVSKGSDGEAYCVENGLTYSYSDPVISDARDFTYELRDGTAETYAVITGYTGTALVDVLQIPDVLDGYPVREIGSYAFSGCTLATGTLVIPETVETVGSHAFDGCTGIDAIEVRGEPVLNGSCFCNCTGIKRLVVPGSLFDNGTHSGEDDMHGALPWIFGDFSFGYVASHYRIEQVTIVGSFTKVGAFDFHGMYSLASLELPDTVKSIEQSAFAFCGNLRDISIPSGVKTIESNAFLECTSLSDISIPSGVKTIASSAFSHCTSLTGTLVIPASVESVESYAFDGCIGYTAIEVLGEPVLANSCFSGCSGVKRLRIPGSVFYYSQWSNGSPIGGALAQIFESYDAYPYRDIEELTITSDFTTIGSYEFYGMSKLTSLALPDTVNTIGDHAFAGCTSLRDFVIPSGVKTISNWAFSNCASLTCLALPEGITTISYSAFSGAGGLRKIYIPQSVTSIQSSAFYNHSADLVIYGEAGSYAETFAAGQGIVFSTKDADFGLAQMSGTVLADDLTPLPGVIVSVYQDRALTARCATATTDSNGAWRWGGAKVNGQYWLMFAKAGYTFTPGSCRVVMSAGDTEAPRAVGARRGYAINGRVLSPEGRGVSDARVTLFTAEGAFVDSTRTDDSGAWAFSQNQGAAQYRVELEKTAMTISPATIAIAYGGTGDVTAENALATALMDAESAEVCAFTMSQTDIYVGETVTFTVQAPAGATAVRMWADGNTYDGDQCPVTDGMATLTRRFTMIHAQGVDICFQPLFGDKYGVKCAPQTLIVRGDGQLSEPTVTVAQSHVLGRPLSYSYASVEHADAYIVSLLLNGGKLFTRYYAPGDVPEAIEAEYFAQPGDYVLFVMATGDRYSQSEASAVIIIEAPDYKLRLLTPRNGDTFIVGDTLWVTAQHQNGWARIRVTAPDGSVQYYPQNRRQMTETENIAPSFALTMGGEYRIDAFVFAVDQPAGDEGCVAQAGPLFVKVNGPQISHVYFGGNTFTWIAPEELALTKVLTNNAVDTLTIRENGQVLATLGQNSYQQDAETYQRTYSLASLATPSKGLHTYTFTGQSAQGQATSVTQSVYVVEPVSGGDIVYPMADGLTLVSSPINGARVTAVSGGALFDALTVIGDGGAWYRLKNSDGQIGFASLYAVSGEAPAGASGQVTLTSPADAAKLDASATSLAIAWKYGVPVKRAHQIKLAITDAATGAARWTQTFPAVEEDRVLNRYTLAEALPKGEYKLRLSVLGPTGVEQYQSDPVSFAVGAFAADLFYRQWWAQNVMTAYNRNVTVSVNEPICGMRGENTLWVIPTYDESFFGFTQALKGYENVWRLAAMKFVEDYNDSTWDARNNAQNNYTLLSGQELDQRALIIVAETLMDDVSKNKLTLKTDYSNMTPSSLANWKVNSDGVARNTIMDAVDAAYNAVKVSLDAAIVLDPVGMETAGKAKKVVVEIVDLIKKVFTDTVASYYASYDATTLLKAYANEYWQAIREVSAANVNHLKSTYWGDKWNAGGYDGESRFQAAARKCVDAFETLGSNAKAEQVRSFATHQMLLGTNYTEEMITNASAASEVALRAALSPETLIPSIFKGISNLFKAAIKDGLGESNPILANVLKRVDSAAEKYFCYDSATGIRCNLPAFLNAVVFELSDETATQVIESLITANYRTFVSVIDIQYDYNSLLMSNSGAAKALTQNWKSLFSGADALFKESWKLGESLCYLGHDLLESDQQKNGKGAYDDTGVALMTALHQISDIQVEAGLVPMNSALIDTLSIANLEALRQSALHLMNAKELALICYRNMGVIRENSKQSWNSEYRDQSGVKHDYTWLTPSEIDRMRSTLYGDRTTISDIPARCLPALPQ